MKIRTKVFLIVVAIFGLLFFGISQIFTAVESANFERLEKQNAFKDMNRVEKAIANENSKLAEMIASWSHWNDAYAFIQDGNQTFIDTNLSAEIITQLQLNFIAIKNDVGESLFEKYVNKEGNEMPFPQAIKDVLNDTRISDAAKRPIQLNFSGIVETADGPYVIAIQSVTSSDGGASPKGLMAFGYKADEDFMAALSEATLLQLDSAPLTEIEKIGALLALQKNLSITERISIQKTAEYDSINVFMLTDDIFGEPGRIFKAQIKRDVYLAGLDNIARINLFLVGVAFLIVIIVLSLFEFFVLRKIDKLMSGVQRVGSLDYVDEQLLVSGKDEFAKLGLEINKMLDAVEKTRLEKKETEKRFLNIADSAPVMIWISDEKNKIVYVNTTLTDFLGKSEKELFGDAWISVIHPEDKEKVLLEYADAAAKKQKISLKYRVMNAKSEYRWILVEAITRITPRGLFKGYTGTAIDVTQFEESDQRKIKYIEEIEKMNRLMVSRELKMVELKKQLRDCEVQEKM
ncbi:MAG: PAS domain S-box protein [Candidatus Moranbacteria bacterium]|nr:PAS domain S-box protein [Candidatus Moranbacteria bacterium]